MNAIDATMTRTGAPGPPAEADLELRPGHVIGRYALLEEVGRGGMGVVWAAYDPVLDRRVALKLVHFRQAQGTGSETDTAEMLQARMIREAQALARLNHANVVQVHDAGAIGDGAFVAMEYVAGKTLRQWLGTSRSVDEIVDVFLKAGRGLAAAHAAGLVHRDFKPSNVLIGDDGRVRVGDFGVARREHEPEAAGLTSPASPASDSARGPASEPAHTITGRVIGTPRYMAPEQLDGRAADARSDQFSFCVAFYEAVFREHPFLATDERAEPALLAARITAGALRELRQIGPVERKLRTLAERGLAASPAKRYARLADLLDELERLRRPPRSRLALVAAIGLVGLGVVAVATRGGGRTTADPCAAPAAAIDTLWNPQRADALGLGFTSALHRRAPDAWAVARRGIDSYALRWRDARIKVCVAGRAQDGGAGQGLSAATTAARERCLRGQLAELGALLDLAARPDALMVRTIGDGSAALPAPERCVARQAGTSEPAPPDSPAKRAEMLAIEELLARVAATLALFRTDEAGPLVAETLTRAEALGHEPLIASALLAQSQLLHMKDQNEEALAPARRVLVLADALGDDDLRHRALMNIVIVEIILGRIDDARADLVLAEAVGRRLPPDDERQSWTEFELADLAHAARDGNTCLEHAERSLALRERARGPNDPEVARVLIMLGACAHHSDTPEKAFPQLERALAIYVDAYGARHPNVATVRFNLGRAEKIFDRFDKAEAQYREALAIYLEYFPETHSKVVMSIHNLANVYVAMKRYPQAIEYADRAATLWREINGPGSGSEAAAISIGGHARKESGDYAGAEAKYREALALRRARPEPKARDVVSSLDDLGGTLVLAGRVDEGLGVLEEAMTLATKTGAKVPADQIASVEIELAKGLIKARRDRPRALALARAAHDRLVGADEAAERAEVAKWLAEQGAPVP